MTGIWTRTGSIMAVALCLYSTGGIAQPLQLTQPQFIAQQSTQDEADAKFCLTLGLVLLQEGTTESLRTAIPLFEKAATLYEQIDNQARQALALVGLGRIHNLLGEQQKALNYYDQGLLLIRAVGDHSSEAITLANIGLVYSDLGEEETALDYYNQALPLTQAVGDRRHEALTLNGIGSVYDQLGEEEKALDYYNQALLLSKTVGDRKGEAFILHNLARVYHELGEEEIALDYYNQALPLSKAVGDRRQEAKTLQGIGSVYADLGEKQQALNYYNQALLLSKTVGDRTQEAATLNNIGSVYSALGEKQKALEYLNQALPLSRAVGDRAWEATTLNNIGLVYHDLGEKQKALDYYNQALSLSRAVGNLTQEAVTLNNMGGVYSDLGEKQKALDYYNQVLPLSRAVGDRTQEAATLNNIGLVYNDLGEKQKALEYLNQALPLLRAVGDRAWEAKTLNNIGKSYSDLGEKQKALDYYDQALPLSRAVGDRGGEAITLSNMGKVYSDLGEKQKALDYFNQALPKFQAVSDRRGEAGTLNNIGAVYNDLGEKQKALDYFNQALPKFQAVGDRAQEATTLGNIALTKSSLGNLTEALTDIQAVIEIVEDLRSKIGSQDLRASYFATVQGNYKFYIDILMGLHQQNPNGGYDALALHISERSRARSLVELLTEANADIRQGVDPQLLEKEQNLIQQLNAVEHRRHELVSGQYSEAELEELKQKSQSLLTQLDQLEAQIRLKSPRYANLQYPEPLNLEQIQNQVLDEDTLLLTYSLGIDGFTGSYLWAVTKDGITSYELPSQTEIEAAANTFRESVLSDNGGDLSPGLPLSQILLSPVADQLQGKRLLIVGDGVLQYVPFAALPLPSSPTTPLLVQNEIVTLSSASTIAIQRQQLQNRPTVAKKLAVLADPVFSETDERLSGVASQPDENISLFAITRATRNLGLGEGGELLPRLRYTRTEADKILALVPEEKQMKAFGFEASRSLATDPNLAQYQIVHLATHGLLDPVNPELSGVVLSLLDQNGDTQNGFLRLNDIFNLNLPAELVVLSACETGLGENIRGEGLVGLTRGFMYAGARRVVVSLWAVNDIATSEVMAKFYQKMLNQEQNPVVALREAQLEMWNSEQWQSPYFWAAFTIQGDWK